MRETPAVKLDSQGRAQIAGEILCGF